MKRSKSQAVYRYLPDMWISDRLPSGIAVTARLKNWNHVHMTGIYDSFIESEIKHQIRLFSSRGGDIRAFGTENDIASFRIVEPACNEGVPDIIGEISPLVFYCSSCGAAHQERSYMSVNSHTWKCVKPECGKHSVKQLQMIYACECGHAEPIKMPYIQGINEYTYRPNSDTYKMAYKRNGNTQFAEFAITCPTCNKRLVPDNANSGRNYKPFTLRVINLVDDKAGKFYEKGEDAQMVIIAKWFEEISIEQYTTLLDNVDFAFSANLRSYARRSRAEEQIRSLIEVGLIAESGFSEAVHQILVNDKTSEYGIERAIVFCNRMFSKNSDRNWFSNYSFKMMQYDTLKYSRRIITLNECIEHQIELGYIESPLEIHSLNSRMGIKNMQVSFDIEIVNCTYGYTRRASNPSQSTNGRLKLNAYGLSNEGDSRLAYGSKLNTEGILFEINQGKILDWLNANGVINEEQMPDTQDTMSVKRWYAEHVHGDSISVFGEPGAGDPITSYVFSLLHTMSHAFLRAAGEMSGLSVNSLAEIIIIDAASIFIYSQTSQGIPLGALSGMAESNYREFLEKAYVENRMCIFDPICSDRDNTSCSACVQIADISCNHFNCGLGRKYLYTTLNTGSPSIGYWDM
jgi:hypothetical protein